MYFRTFIWLFFDEFSTLPDCMFILKVESSMYKHVKIFDNSIAPTSTDFTTTSNSRTKISQTNVWLSLIPPEVSKIQISTLAKLRVDDGFTGWMKDINARCTKKLLHRPNYRHTRKKTRHQKIQLLHRPNYRHTRKHPSHQNTILNPPNSLTNTQVTQQLPTIS